MTETNMYFTYGILLFCAVTVIAIIVYLSKIDKFAQGVSDTVDSWFISSVIQLEITASIYSDSSNIKLWQDIANAICNWNGMSIRPFIEVTLLEMFVIVEGSINNTAYSEKQKHEMLSCIFNLRRNMEKNLPDKLTLESIKTYPGCFERNIRSLVNKHI